jgi:nucleoside-diphosphate-sugar epimerase
MQRCLVTGGAGFVGSHLVDELLSRGHRVTVLDNLITGRMENLAHHRGRRGFLFLRADVTRPLPKSLPRHDRVYHLASPASPVGYMRHSIETILTNSVGTLNMLDYCRKRRARFLFASTSEVYGDPAIHPQKETYWGHVNSFGPRSCYDESKRLGEALVYEALRKWRVDARMVRIFNTYGPRLNEKDGRVVSNFIVQGLRGRRLTVYGGGRQTRSFCYVSDLVDGLIRAMEKPGTRGGVFNLGNPRETKVAQFALLVLKILGLSRSMMVNKPLPQDDPTRRCPDIGRARRTLGWKPRVTLEEGLSRTVEWYRPRIKRRS